MPSKTLANLFRGTCAACVLFLPSCMTEPADEVVGENTKADTTSFSRNTSGVEVSKTAFTDGQLVWGTIQFTNVGEHPEMLSGLADSLEIHFPGNVTPPPLPSGSTPKWFKVADVPVQSPGVIPAGETVTINYSFDLCAAADFSGANSMRNVVEVTLADKPPNAPNMVVTRSESFEPSLPDCPDLWIEKVDREGALMSAVTIDVTFPDGSVQQCTTDASGFCHLEHLPVGTYRVDEPFSPDWALVGCQPDENPGTQAAELTLTYGDSVTVTCTNQPRVGEGSCIGEDACTGNTGIIGNNSCIGIRACFNNSANIGDGSCSSGAEACRQNSGDIGAGSCIGGNRSCQDNFADVGNGSCDGEDACHGNGGPISDGSCIGSSACNDNERGVGNSSCQGSQACTRNLGVVGNNACIGMQACFQNSAEVGDGQCIGDEVCKE